MNGGGGGGVNASIASHRSDGGSSSVTDQARSSTGLTSPRSLKLSAHDAMAQIQRQQYSPLRNHCPRVVPYTSSQQQQGVQQGVQQVAGAGEGRAPQAPARRVVFGEDCSASQQSGASMARPHSRDDVAHDKPVRTPEVGGEVVALLCA